MSFRYRRSVVFLLIALLAMLPLRMAQSSASVDSMDASVSASDVAHTTHCDGDGGGDPGCGDSCGGACPVCATVLPADIRIVVPAAARAFAGGSVNPVVSYQSLPPFRPPRA